MEFVLKRNLKINRIKKITQSFFKYSYLIIGIVTLIWTLSFIAFHFYVSSIFGFNPSYDNPTYTDFYQNKLIVDLIKYISGFWVVAFLCAFCFFPIIICINLILKYTTELKLNLKMIGFSFLCCLISYLILFAPYFGNTFEWMLD